MRTATKKARRPAPSNLCRGPHPNDARPPVAKGFCGFHYRQDRQGERLTPAPQQLVFAGPSVTVHTRVGDAAVRRLEAFGARFNPPLSRYHVASLILERWRPGEMGIKPPKA